MQGKFALVSKNETRVQLLSSTALIGELSYCNARKMEKAHITSIPLKTPSGSSHQNLIRKFPIKIPPFRKCHRKPIISHFIPLKTKFNYSEFSLNWINFRSRKFPKKIKFFKQRKANTVNRKCSNLFKLNVWLYEERVGRRETANLICIMETKKNWLKLSELIYL